MSQPPIHALNSSESRRRKLAKQAHRPNAGVVRVAGADVAGWPPHHIARQGVGIVFQHSRPQHQQTHFENIVLGLLPDKLLKPVASQHVRKKARAVGERVGLGDVLNRKPNLIAAIGRLSLTRIPRRSQVAALWQPIAPAP